MKQGNGGQGNQTRLMGQENLSLETKGLMRLTGQEESSCVKIVGSKSIKTAVANALAGRISGGSRNKKKANVVVKEQRPVILQRWQRTYQKQLLKVYRKQRIFIQSKGIPPSIPLPTTGSACANYSTPRMEKKQVKEKAWGVLQTKACCLQSSG